MDSARTLLAEARDAYEQTEASEEETQLIELVTARVDAATFPSLGKTEAKRPPPPTEEQRRLRAESKARGEEALMEAVQVFGDKSDAERFGKALRLLETSREAFRFAGDDVEREREPVLGNLYAVIRAEEERMQRVDKLVRLKQVVELRKQRDKAASLGLDELLDDVDDVDFKLD